MLAACLATLLFAVSSVSARRTVGVLGPASANFWRILIASIVLGIYGHWLGAGLGGPALGWFFLSGLIGYGIGDFGIFMALPTLGSRLTSLMTQCLAAPFAALLEWACMGTRLKPLELLSGAIILGGVALALAPERQSGQTTILVSRRGILFGVIAALGQAGGAVLSRYGFLLSRDQAFEINGLSVAYQRVLPGLVFGGIWFLLSRRAFKIGNAPASDSAQRRRILPWILFNGVVGPCVGVAFYQHALQTVPTGVVMSIAALTPLAVIPFAMWLDGERPSIRSLWGGAVAVAGAILLARVRF